MSGSIERRRHGGLARLTLLTLTGGAAAVALLLRVGAVAPRSASVATTLPVDRWVELAVLAAGLVAAAWLALSGAIALGCVVASLLGRRWRAGEAAVERIAPAAVRRLVRSAVGVGVGTGLALAPTVALAADVSPTPPAADGTSVVLDLGWRSTSGPAAADTATPDTATSDTATPNTATTSDEAIVDAPSATEPEVTSTEQPPPVIEPSDPTAAEEVAATPVTRGAAGPSEGTDDGPADDTHVVLRGDTLWEIAARALGGDPTDAEVLREVTRWHEANRDVVGADPDHILPGQILRTPA